jgi:hypothetical protein
VQEAVIGWLLARDPWLARVAIPVLAAVAGPTLAAAGAHLRNTSRVAPVLGPTLALAALLVDPAVWTAVTPSRSSSVRDAVVGASFDLKQRNGIEAAPGVLVPWDVANEVLVLVSFFAGSGFPEDGVPHLAHLLPRFASVQAVPRSALRLPAVWTYERVAGARVTGSTAPRSRVVLEIDLVTRGRPWRWRAWAEADTSGRYSMTVPLPTGWSTATVGTGPIGRSGQGSWRPILLPEGVVRSGGTIAYDLAGL